VSGAKDLFERHSFVGALSKKIHPKGLTLVEVLATAAIVGMFAGLISPVFLDCEIDLRLVLKPLKL